MTSSTPLTHQVDGIGPPVLLLNGEMMTMASWEPVAAGLMVSRQVVRCDFRGQLLTDGLAPDTIDGHVRDVVELLDHLSLPLVDVVGTSFGGAVALRFASSHPARVRSLIAAQSAAYARSESTMPSALFEACRQAAAGDGGGDVVFELMADRWFSAEYLAENAEIFDLRRQGVAGFPAEYFAALLSMMGILETMDLRSGLGRITAPTLVVESAFDRVHPAPASFDISESIAGAELITLPGATHGVLVENPGQLFEVVQAFLSRHSP